MSRLVFLGVAIFSTVMLSYFLARVFLWVEDYLKARFPEWTDIRNTTVTGFTVIGAFCAILIIAGLITGL